MTAEITFPRQQARTLRFTLGAPHSFAIAPDGSRIAFLRSRSGTDRVNCLWVRDVASGTERVVADPAVILDGASEDLPPEERARRERVRQAGEGVVAFATDRAVSLAVFTLSGRLFTADLGHAPLAGNTPDGASLAGNTPYGASLAGNTPYGSTVQEITSVKGPVVDPRPDPGGAHIAYVSGGALRVVAADGSGDRALAEPEAPDVSYGLAEFVAAEEMGRTRGYWWSPDGQSLLIARVDVSQVVIWHVSDPASPERPATAIRYPAAGTANADVTLILAGLDGSRHPAGWDTAAFPYLTSVYWSKHGPALIQIQTRDQRTVQVLTVAADGSTTVLAEDRDPCWVSLVPGTPAWTASGSLVRVVARDGAYRVMIGDELATTGEDAPQVREVLDVAGDVLFTASGPDPTQIHVYTAGPAGVTQVTEAPGTHSATRSGGITILRSGSLEWSGPRVHLLRDGVAAGQIESYTETPVLTPAVTHLVVGEHALRCALLLPRGYKPGSDPALPVLLDPYGGPAGQRVMSTRNIYLEPQWFADQGFAVVVIDGRGTPGRGPGWDRLIQYHQSTPNLEDQADGLAAVATAHPYLDTSRVAIRGWSHGGYLAALAVLRRPDVFHAAVAGAPVSDERLYDTHYTERFLGLPDEHPEAYEQDSLLADAPKLRRPLMLIHGLADDNVLVAHTLRLSAALLAAGRPHTVLPLTGITHMAAKHEDVAENLLLLQLDFIRRALGIAGKTSPA